MTDYQLPITDFMDLLEYQAKELFREIGIPVLRSQSIDQPRDLKDLKIPYPVVLKSQVPKGGRGRAGGIKFVENTIDAIAAAQTIFNLPIMGEYPKVLLAEARYNAAQEFYLAVALDYTLRRPVLLGSPQGGMDSEAVREKMQRVVVDRKFSPFYARRLTLKMGLQGKLIMSVSTIVEAMYKLFIQKDLDLVEINPLGVSPQGEVMALDGKVTVNDAALGRHPDLALLGTTREEGDEKNCPASNYYLPQLVEPEGNIAVVCNGKDLAIATLDLLYQAGGKPGCYWNVTEEMTDSAPGTSLCDRLEQGFQLLTENSRIKIVFVNILGGATSGDGLAAVLAKYLPPNAVASGLKSPSGRHRRTANGSSSTPQPEEIQAIERSLPHYPHFVIRLVGSYLAPAKEHLATLGVPVVDKLDDAVSKAVTLAKSASKSA
jgi:succinyl-CoA synthetase beta subunit